MKFNKKSKDSKDNSIKESKKKSKKIPKGPITLYDEEIKNISFGQLFKYSSRGDKILIFIGLINSVLQGGCLPFLVNFMGDFVDSFISLVVNITIKNETGIKDDNILMDFFNILTTNPNNITSFEQQHPDINVGDIMNNFQHSSYAGYDLSDARGFSFKPMSSISSELNKQFILYTMIALISFVSAFINYAFLDISAFRQTTRIRSLVFKSIMKQEVAWHEKTSAGELTSRIISDSLLIEDGIGNKMGMLVQNAITFVICIVIAFTSQWKLTLYMSAFFIAIAAIVSVMSTVLISVTKRAQDSYGTAGGIAQEAFSQIRTIVSFGTEQKEIDRYVNELDTPLRLGKKKAKVSGISVGLIFGTAYLSYSLVFIISSSFINRGEMMASDALKVLMGIMFGATAFGASSQSIASFSTAMGAAAKLYHIIERKTKIDVEKGERPSQPIRGEIEFRDVHFTYPARPDTEVLKGISFHCQPGQTVALVGASGSGKSTIVQLLERFYDRSDGDIFIDGKPIEDYNIHWLHTQMGLVSQEPTLFNTSIAENISITNPNVPQAEIEAVAKLANAHGFISKLPNGYQTHTGEKGLQLSGGQKQRICIARALMLNPKILLLDEATSALDNRSEKIVQAALDLASSGRTTIVIAHRLTTVKNADHIIVMDKGVIVESGTHDELMVLQKVYYNLVKNQEIHVKENEISNDSNSDSDSDSEEEEEEEDKNNENNKTTDDDNHSATDLLNKHSTDLSTVRVLSTHSNASFGREPTSTSLKSLKSKKGKGESFKLKRYLSYNKSLWVYNVIGLIGSIINGCMQPACSYIYASAISAFNFQGDKLKKETQFWGIMFIVLAVVNFMTVFFKNTFFTIAGEYLSYFFRKDMYNSIIRQEVGFFDTCDNEEVNTKKSKKMKKKSSSSSSTTTTVANSAVNSTGTLTAKLSTEATLVQNLNLNFGTLLEIVSGIVLCFTIAFTNGWKLALILLGLAPFLL